MSDWLKIYENNVAGHYFTSIAFLPLLVAGNEDRKGFSSAITSTTSISGLIKSNSGGQWAYGCSKAADNHLTKM